MNNPAKVCQMRKWSSAGWWIPWVYRILRTLRTKILKMRWRKFWVNSSYITRSNSSRRSPIPKYLYNFWNKKWFVFVPAPKKLISIFREMYLGTRIQSKFWPTDWTICWKFLSHNGNKKQKLSKTWFKKEASLKIYQQKYSQKNLPPGKLTSILILSWERCSYQAPTNN